MAKKGKKRGGGKRGWPRWLTFVLGGVAVAGVMGAFERLVKFDNDQSPLMKGIFMAGAALAGAFLLRKGKLIGGGTAAVIGGVGVAMGAHTAFGGKVYEIGNNLADSFAGMFKKSGTQMQTKPQTGTQPNPGSTSGGGIGIDGVQTGFGPAATSAGVTGFSGPAQQQQPQAPAAAAGGAQAATQTIIYEAPKIKSSDYLIGKGIDAVAAIGGAVIGSAFKGSGNDRVRRFGMAA